MNTTERIKRNMEQRDLPRVTLTVSVPPHVMDDLVELAPLHGFETYRGLVLAYISAGLRKDLSEQNSSEKIQRVLSEISVHLIDGGVPEETVLKAVSELDARRQA